MFTSRVLLCVLFSCIVQTVSADSYHFSRRLRTHEDGDMNVHVFETVLSKGLDKCIKKCKAKKRCKYINYVVQGHKCFLIGIKRDEDFIIANSVEKKRGYIFGNITEWNMNEYSPCVDCSDNGECNVNGNYLNGICENSGCPVPEQEDRTSLHGNMFSVGSKMTYQCNEGYAMNHTDNSMATCKDSGTWSLTRFKCLPEVVFTADVMRLGDTYYKLMRNTNTWNEAKLNCENVGGYLTDIKSQEEQAIIIQLISSLGSAVWIGGKSMRHEVNTFIWLDGTTVSSGYVNWKRGQPYHSAGGIRCMCLQPSWNYQWDDADCNINIFSVCEVR